MFISLVLSKIVQPELRSVTCNLAWKSNITVLPLAGATAVGDSAAARASRTEETVAGESSTSEAFEVEVDSERAAETCIPAAATVIDGGIGLSSDASELMEGAEAST